VPGLVDLPESPAFASIAGRFRMMLGFVRDDPVRDARIYARVFGGALNVCPNGEPSVRSDPRPYR